MTLDVKTLFLLTMSVEALLGLLLMLAWAQNFSARAVAWWSSANLVRAFSIELYGLYGMAPDVVSIDLASALLFTSYGLTWTGARVFNRRKPLPGSLAAGATAWLIACQFPAFATAQMGRGVLSGLIVACFCWLTAYEFWRGRNERLMSRWPTILVLFSNGALFLMRTPLTSLLPAWRFDDALSSGWIAVLSPESILISISIAFVLLAMAKEHAELRHRTDALVDPLTGLANRRAFLQNAERVARRQTERIRPVAVFLLDIDQFKSINDRFGHAAGDQALRLVARICTTNLRTTDLVGRLGGDEFAVLLADANRDNAFLVAERIRKAFAAAATTIGNQTMTATMSVGVAIIQEPEQDLGMLIDQADQALYRAKAQGRNRVALAPMPEVQAEPAATAASAPTPNMAPGTPVAA